jgi:argininosuccinate lyase
MGKMWSTKQELDPLIEQYTVGDDPEVDLEFMRFEILSTRAHCEMLLKMGILTKSELHAIEHALDELEYLLSRKEFKIEIDEEDCHGALENFLVRRVGETAFKVHIFRSRNEQVLNIVRLYCRHHLNGLSKKLHSLKEVFEKRAEECKNVAMPGYTHSQRAMPTTVGVWFGSFASLIGDDITLVKFASKQLNRSPLGSAAGFGTTYPIERDFLATKLKYASVQENPLSCQNGRCKETELVLFALSQVAATLSKFAADCLLFTTEEFNFFSLDDRFLTGSSIMPNKRNYDLFELARAKCADVFSSLIEVFLLDKGLTSGYHRDFQLLKKPLVTAFKNVNETVAVIRKSVLGLQLNEARLKEAVSDERLYATQKATELALREKIPYRHAYFKVKQSLEDSLAAKET